MIPKLLKVEELAEILGISRQGIYNGLSSGAFPIKPIRLGKRLIRFREADVQKFLEGKNGRK